MPNVGQSNREEGSTLITEKSRIQLVLVEPIYVGLSIQFLRISPVFPLFDNWPDIVLLNQSEECGLEKTRERKPLLCSHILQLGTSRGPTGTGGRDSEI